MAGKLSGIGLDGPDLILFILYSFCRSYKKIILTSLLALFRVCLEMRFFLSRVIFLYSFPAEKQRIHVFSSRLVSPPYF